MAPNKKSKVCAPGGKPHQDHHHHHKDHHHHRHHHHDLPPPPGFLGLPGFMESHPKPNWDARFSHHHHPPGGEAFFHCPPRHHRFGGGPHGRGCWPDPRGAWWEDSSEKEEVEDPSRDEFPEMCFPQPGRRQGWGGSRRGFGRGMWGPRGGSGRGGSGRSGSGRGGSGRGGLGRGGYDCGGFGRKGFGRSGFGGLPFGHFWFEDSDSSSSEEDEAAGADYKATFDLGQYIKKNISVRLAGRHLIVEAKGREKKGPADQRQEMCRRYFVEHHSLPKKIDVCQMTAILNADGLLTVRAPQRDTDTVNEEASFCEQEVQIQQEQCSDEELGEQADECMDAAVMK